MAAKQISTYYKDLQASFHRDFNAALKSLKRSDIHHMRVRIKELRVIWSLIDLVCHEEWSKKAHSDLFERLFTESGNLREVQVNLKTLSKFHKGRFPVYVDYQKELERSYREKLIICMQEFDLGKLKLLDDRLAAYMQIVTNDIILDESVRTILEKTGKIKKQLPDTSKLHKIRIEIRAIQEMLSTIGALNPGSDWDKLEDKIKKLNIRIGNWHDDVVLLESLAEFVTQNPKGIDIRSYEKLIKRIEKKQHEREGKLEKRIEKFVYRVTDIGKE